MNHLKGVLPHRFVLCRKPKYLRQLNFNSLLFASFFNKNIDFLDNEERRTCSIRNDISSVPIEQRSKNFANVKQSIIIQSSTHGTLQIFFIIEGYLQAKFFFYCDFLSFHVITFKITFFLLKKIPFNVVISKWVFLINWIKTIKGKYWQEPTKFWLILEKYWFKLSCHGKKAYFRKSRLGFCQNCIKLNSPFFLCSRKVKNGLRFYPHQGSITLLRDSGYLFAIYFQWRHHILWCTIVTSFSVGVMNIWHFVSDLALFLKMIMGWGHRY